MSKIPQEELYIAAAKEPKQNRLERDSVKTKENPTVSKIIVNEVSKKEFPKRHNRD